MALGGLLVASAIYSASQLWREVYARLDDLLEDYYAALLACASIQAALSVLAYPLAIFFCKGNGCDVSAYRDNCLLEEAFLSASAGFFLFDLPYWRARLSLTSVVFLLHHLGSLGILVYTLHHGRGAFCLLRLSAILQLNTPLLLLRNWQYEKGYDARLTELAFLASYVVLKLVIYTQTALEMSADPNLPTAFKVAAVLTLFSVIGLFPGVLRMTLHRTHNSGIE